MISKTTDNFDNWDENGAPIPMTVFMTNTINFDIWDENNNAGFNEIGQSAAEVTTRRRAIFIF